MSIKQIKNNINLQIKNSYKKNTLLSVLLTSILINWLGLSFSFASDSKYSPLILEKPNYDLYFYNTSSMIPNSKNQKALKKFYLDSRSVYRKNSNITFYDSKDYYKTNREIKLIDYETRSYAIDGIYADPNNDFKVSLGKLSSLTLNKGASSDNIMIVGNFNAYGDSSLLLDSANIKQSSSFFIYYVGNLIINGESKIISSDKEKDTFFRTNTLTLAKDSHLILEGNNHGLSFDHKSTIDPSAKLTLKDSSIKIGSTQLSLDTLSLSGGRSQIVFYESKDGIISKANIKNVNLPKKEHTFQIIGNSNSELNIDTINMVGTIFPEFILNSTGSVNTIINNFNLLGKVYIGVDINSNLTIKNLNIIDGNIIGSYAGSSEIISKNDYISLDTLNIKNSRFYSRVKKLVIKDINIEGDSNRIDTIFFVNGSKINNLFADKLNLNSGELIVGDAASVVRLDGVKDLNVFWSSSLIYLGSTGSLIVLQNLNINNNADFTYNGKGNANIEVDNINSVGNSSIFIEPPVGNHPYGITANNLNLKASNFKLGAGQYATFTVKNIEVDGLSSFNLNMPITAKNLNLKDGSNLTFDGDKELSVNNINSFGNASLIIKKQLTTDNLILNSSNLNISNRGKLIVTKDIDIQGKSILNINNDITAQGLTFGSNANLVISGDKYLEVKKINALSNNSLVIKNTLITDNLNFILGNLTLEGNGKLQVKNDLNLQVNNINITGNNSFNLLTANNNNDYTTDNLNLSGTLNLGLSRHNLSVKNNIYVAGESSLNLGSGIIAKNLNLKEGTKLTVNGDGNLQATNINTLGNNSLFVNNQVTTDNLSLISSNLNVSNTGKLVVSNEISVAGKSSLNFNNSMTARNLILKGNAHLSVSGDKYLELVNISSLGNNVLNIANLVETQSLDLVSSLNLVGNGNLIVREGINLNKNNSLILDNSSESMLGGTKVNNKNGVVSIGDKQLNFESYIGGKGSEIKLNILSPTNYGQIKATDDFIMVDGSFRISIKDKNISHEKQVLNIVSANKINLLGDNIYIYDDVRYSLNPVIDGKNLYFELKKTSFIDPNPPIDPDPDKPNPNPNPSGSKKPTGDILNIFNELQEVVNNNKGNSSFNKDLAVFVADEKNRNYNVGQLKPVSNTTKKEMSGMVVSIFNNMITDRINIFNQEKTIQSIEKIEELSFLDRIIFSTGSFNTWSSLGGNKGKIKGSSLGGLVEDTQNISTKQLMVGADYIDTNFSLGIAGGFGVINSNNESTQRYITNSSAYNTTLYGSYKNDYIYIAGNLGYTAINNENSRFIDMRIVPEENKSTTTDSVISAYAETGLNLIMSDKIILNPFVSLGYSGYILAGYQEQGNGFILKIDGKTYSDMKAGGGLRLLSNIGNLTPMIEISYEQKFNKDKIESEMKFVNVIEGNSISITDDIYSQNKLKLKAGLDYNYSDAMVISIKGYQESNKEITNIGTNLNIIYKF